MVEKWNLSTMYDEYYNECAPIECMYTEKSRNSVLYIVTTLIGLVGGLVTVLKMIAPLIVKLVRRKQTHATIETGMIVMAPKN